MTALDREIRRGEQARRLLEDPLLQESFATVEEGLQAAWRTTSDDAAAERERLWLMLKLLGRVRAHLVAVVETGRLADLTSGDPADARSSARDS